MKYTPQQYEVARKFRDFYYGKKDDKFWETLSESRKDEWVYGSLTRNHSEFSRSSFGNPWDQTEEFFNQKEKTVKPNSYTFVSTDKDVDLLRIIREALAESPFILIEKKNRNSNKTDTFLLVHESILNNPSTYKLPLYGVDFHKNWGIVNLGGFPGTNLTGTGYRAHEIFDYPTRKLRAEIEAVIKALNPKNTKTTVTVW